MEVLISKFFTEVFKMTILKSFHRTSYEILPHIIVENYKSEDKYQVFHFFNDKEIFYEFFKVTVEPGSTVLDCGLNFGMHTDMFIELGAKNVLAFEASKEVLGKIRSKYESNPDVTIIEKALSNEAGKVKFYECNASGASSLRRTRDLREHGGYEYEVEAIRLDDVPLIQNVDYISCIKVDLEGADLLALSGGKNLIQKHKPYIIMEYVDTLVEYELDGQRLNKYSILQFCEKAEYIPFNLYGICVLDAEVFEESIFEDMNDLILVPKCKLEEWTTRRLPKYQYAVFEKLMERIELHDKFPGNLSVMSMCKRIYREVNQRPRSEAIDFLKLVNRNLVRIIKDTSEIDENSDLKKRGALVLKLIYAGLFDQAYELASKKNVKEPELEKFLMLLA